MLNVLSQRRHGRACPGHPRLTAYRLLTTWMPATNAGMTSLLAVLSSPYRRCLRSRPGRRGLLQGQEHRGGDRLQSRRRLRPLCAHARASHGQIHPGQSGARAAEHAGRRRACASRSIILPGGAEGRPDLRHLHAHGRHRAAVRSEPELRQLETHLARRHHRLGQRLRHLAHVAGEDLEGLPRKAGHARRHRAERRARYLHQPLQERVRRQHQARVRLSRHRRDHARDGARRARRRLRHRLDHASRRSASAGSRRSRSTSSPRRPSARTPTCRTSR